MGTFFSAFRLKKTTVEQLQMLKRAFELTNVQPLSNDYFIEMLMDYVQKQNEKVWKTYIELMAIKEHAASDSTPED